MSRPDVRFGVECRMFGAVWLLIWWIWSGFRHPGAVATDIRTAKPIGKGGALHPTFSIGLRGRMGPFGPHKSTISGPEAVLHHIQ